MVEESEREQLERMVSHAQEYLLTRYSLRPEHLLSQEVKSTYWKDSAMEIPPLPHEPVERGTRPGFVLLFRTEQGKHRFHADLTTGRVRYDSRMR